MLFRSKQESALISKTSKIDLDFEQGRWLSGFMVNIGQSTNTVAELWGLLSGLLGIWVFGV